MDYYVVSHTLDKENIIYWFEHIAQIADDRMTATGQRMTDSHALDEIKAIAKDSVYYIKNHLYDNCRTESIKGIPREC